MCLIVQYLTLIVLGGATASNGAEANKSVMFSDGIRPGGDLTELDGRDGHRFGGVSCQLFPLCDWSELKSNICRMRKIL